LLETAVIGFLYVFIGMLKDLDSLHTISYLQYTYETLGFKDDRPFIIFIGSLMVVFLLAANTVGAISIWAQQWFGWSQVYILSKTLLRAYLLRPYSFFLRRSPAELSKNIHQEVQEVVAGLILPTLDLIASSAKTLLLVALLMYLNPIATLILAAVFALAYAAIFLLTQRALGRVGRNIVESNEARYRITSEAMNGIKSTKLGRYENVFLSAYDTPGEQFSRATTRRSVIAICPRFILEAIAFGGIIIFVLLLVQTNNKFGEIVPTVAVFAGAGYKLMPAMSRLFIAVARMRSAQPSVELIMNDLKVDENLEIDNKKLSVCKSISLSHVMFQYEGASLPSIADVSITIKRNSNVAFVGPTGAGKTTIIDIILGLLEPTSGSLLIDGVAIRNDNVQAWQHRLGYVPQHIFLSNDSVAANIALGVKAADIDQERLRQVADMADLLDTIEHKLESGWKTVVGEQGIRLSGGQIQRIGLARALYHWPEVLVLDEATSALDNATEQRILERIHAESSDRTIIMIAHRLSTIRHCDMIHVLDDGRLVDSGNWSELMQRCALFQQLARGMETAHGA